MRVTRLIAVLALGLPATGGAAERFVEEADFVSTSAPEFRLRVDPRFEYIGAAAFVLKDIADVERYHWVATEAGRVTALVMLQFEGFREGVEGTYGFVIPDAAEQAGSNYRFSPERVALGGFAFVHNTWAYDNGQNIRDNPHAEAAHTARLLADRGYRLDDELIMSRFVTEVGPAQRDELIVFYIEPLRAHGKTLAEFPDGGPPSAAYDELSGLIRQRSLDAVTWLPQ